MKVLLLNGSPHVDGCTKRALREIKTILNEEGIDTEFIEVGKLNISGCTGCLACKKTGKCIDSEINKINELFKEADGMVIGSPVYYSSPNGTLISFLDKLFYSSNFDKSMKVGASVVSCRRSGNTATFDVLNKYFSISSMPIASSTYWNNVHGFTKEDVERDLEGLQTMRNLARNMAFLIKSINLGKEKLGMPLKETNNRTSFLK